jgi:hypothetical protein
MSFDLNIKNYSRDELINMFQLPANFDTNIVEIREAKLKENILNNPSIDRETQLKTINFLTEAKNNILGGIQKQVEKLTNVISESYNANTNLKETAIEGANEHMVQVRKDASFVNSFPGDFFPGVVNPLKKRTLKKNLNIDSRFRENYYTNPSTNYNVTLPITMNNVVQMTLSAIELPAAYYSISKQYGNNFFYITKNRPTPQASIAPLLVEIPDGNYTSSTIIDAINNKLTLNANYSDISFILNITNGVTGSGQTLVGYNLTTVPPNITIELNFQANRFGFDDRSTPLPLKLGWILGFRNGIYKNNINYVSEGIVDVSGPKYLFLVVDDFNNSVNNNFYSAFNSSLLNKNILARISPQITQQIISFNTLEQNNLNLITTPREYFGPVNIQNLRIQLLDEYGRTVDLNNMDFSFCLSLTTVYDI